MAERSSSASAVARATTPAAGDGATARLDSWKEIAAYLGRSVRTVQRWESEEALPVHRLQHDKLGSVYAVPGELDAWWETRRQGSANRETVAANNSVSSVAVLPFADLSREKDQAYFCEGVAEEIMVALSRVKGISMASRGLAFRFAAGSIDVREVGKQLAVAHVVEGSVRKSGERLRISVQLTNTETGLLEWSETYNRQLEDIFAVQQDIARNVLNALRHKVSPTEEAILGRAPTHNPEAYDLYLRGRKFFYSFSEQGIEFAIQLFTRATSTDDTFALAFAGLADCWSYLYLYASRSDLLRDQADWASARAVELDPECAAAHASRGLALSLRGLHQEAEQAFEQAIALDDNLFEAYYFWARQAFAGGEPGKAITLYENAIRVRPEDYQAPLLMAQIYEDLGRREEARAVRLRGVAAAEKHLELNPDDARALYMAANGMVALGRAEEGREYVARALALRPTDAMLLYNVGCIYSMLGDQDAALSCLEHAVTHGLTQKGWVEHDNNLDPLRGDPRFQALLEKLS